MPTATANSAKQTKAKSPKKNPGASGSMTTMTAEKPEAKTYHQKLACNPTFTQVTSTEYATLSIFSPQP
jgi:hypothetical protein